MTKTTKWNEHKGIVIIKKNDFQVIGCETCNYKHIVPIPTTEEMKHIYKDSYYSKDQPQYLKNDTEDLEWLNLSYQKKFDVFEELLPNSQRSVLDIGSGPGFFLLHGKKRGWKTLGIEPSLQAAAHSRNMGLHIFEEFLNIENYLSLGKFDAINIRNVLEHLPDPKAILKIVSQMLSPKGVLCVSVPNDFNPFQNVLADIGFRPWWVVPPHHINYFDPNSLKNLLQVTGFSICLQDTSFPMELFLLMGDNYIENPELGRICHSKRKQLELTIEKSGKKRLFEKLYFSLASQGLGREIIYYARLCPNSQEDL